MPASKSGDLSKGGGVGGAAGAGGVGGAGRVAEGVGGSGCKMGVRKHDGKFDVRQVLSLLALLVQKYTY